MKIVTITLNPALDLTTRLEAMSLGEVNLVSEANLRAAGKGINVAMVLKDLGREVGVTGWLGADNEQSFVSLFAERALDDHFVRVAGSTRINVKISEQSGRVTDLNLPGLTIQQGEVSALEQAIDEQGAASEEVSASIEAVAQLSEKYRTELDSSLAALNDTARLAETMKSVTDRFRI